MESKHKSTAELPIKGDLTAVCTCAVMISILMSAGSAAGILYPQTVYPAADLRGMFVPNDVVNLSIGLPFLLVSLLLIWRSQWIGLLSLSGALLFVLYNYLIYVFAMPLGIAFLLYLVLVILSGWALAGLIAHTDASLVAQRLAGTVPARVTGGILTGLGVLIFFRALGVLLSGMTHHTPIAGPDFAVGVADLLITPLWISGGVLLILRRPFGWAAAFGLLFQASMLFIALIVFLLLQPFLTGAPFRWIDVFVVFAMGSVCFVPLLLFVRGARQNS